MLTRVASQPLAFLSKDVSLYGISLASSFYIRIPCRKATRMHPLFGGLQSASAFQVMLEKAWFAEWRCFSGLMWQTAQLRRV